MFFGFLVLFSEALTFGRQPDKPTIAVERVNNTNVDLVWEILPSSGEVVTSLFFNRQRLGETRSTPIASRKFSTGDPFSALLRNFETEYRTNLPATLWLLNVDNTEEYIYTLEVNYEVNNIPQEKSDQVTVVVRGKFFFLPLTNLGLLLATAVVIPNSSMKLKFSFTFYLRR